MTIKTSVKTGGDLLVHRESVQYNMVGGTVTFPLGGGGGTLPQVAGMPAIYAAGNFTLLEVGLATFDEADVNALLVHGSIISDLQIATAVTPVNDLYSGINLFEGVVINENIIPALDADGNTITLATIKTTLEALGCKFVSEPAKITTQLT